MFELNFLASSLFIGIKNSLGVENFKIKDIKRKKKAKQLSSNIS